MSEFFDDHHRAVQDRFETRALADRVATITVHTEIQESDKLFIESRDMFFLASVDKHGQPTCSYKGGEPGFIKVLNTKSIAFPTYDGNGMFLSMGNISATAKIGMLFLDFETQSLEASRHSFFRGRRSAHESVLWRGFNRACCGLGTLY